MLYSKLGYLNGDLAIDEKSIRDSKLPYTFVNHLLQSVDLWLHPYENKTCTTKVATLAAGDSFSIREHKGRELVSGDVFDVLFVGKKILAAPSFALEASRKHVDIGTVAYDSYGDNQSRQTGITSDIPSIYVINRFPFNVMMYLDGNPYAEILADDRMDYMGGSKSVMLINNHRQGLKFGQVFDFYNECGQRVATHTVGSNFSQNLYIGVVTMRSPCNSFVDRPLNDRLVYGGEHDLKYYQPINPQGTSSGMCMPKPATCKYVSMHFRTLER